MTNALHVTKDNAEGRLNLGINAAITTIVLDAGEGAEFPQPYTGSASSSGSATTLNDTGDLGNLAVGDFIRNVTDGSCAWVTVAGTNSVTTTRLRGGTDNLWDSGDVWQVNEFVATIETRDGSTPPVVTAREKVLISNRSTDTLTARTRGYDGSTAQSFLAGAYVNLHVVSATTENLTDVLYTMAVRENTNQTDIATNLASIGTLQTGSYHYVVTTGSANAYVAATPALAAYAAGNLVVMNANFSNTGTATLNLNGLGAKTIKKNDGATNLAANDIISGQVVVLRYDGTNFQMLSPVGTPATVTYYDKTVFCSGTSSAALSNPTSDTAYDTHTYTIVANDLANGTEFSWAAAVEVIRGTTGTFTFGVRVGGTVRVQATAKSLGASTTYVNARGRITGTAAAGASVAVKHTIELLNGDGSSSDIIAETDYASVSLATNGTLAVAFSSLFGSSNAGNSTTVLSSRITKHSTTAFA